MQAENVIREKHAGDIEQLKFIFSDENRIIVTADYSAAAKPPVRKNGNHLSG